MKTYLIDLDGTMYSGNTNIDGAREFIAYLQEKGFPYIFLTNNATRTKTQAKEHMLNLGFKNIKEDDFFTSAIATAKYIAKNYSERKCFMIGESGLEEALKEENFIFVEDKADFVQVVPIELSTINQTMKGFFCLHIYDFFWIGSFSKDVGPKHWSCCLAEAPACKKAVVTL